MSRKVSLECDWCHIDADLPGTEDPIEFGWIGVENYDILKEEIVERDFCSTECLISFFSE